MVIGCPRKRFLIKVLIVIVLLIVFYYIFSKILNFEQNDRILPSYGKVRSGHRLAVIVPFRDRFTELQLFLPHLHRFLTRQKLSFSINIINQNDSLRFNRASLINVGYHLIKNDCDYLAMHDVDLLPLNDKLDYGYPETGCYHVSSPNLHPKYHYSKYFGGILIITNKVFESVNGMSNKYWGWGLEDDEFYLRIRNKTIKIDRPQLIGTGRENTFSHIHGSNRKRDYAKILNQKEVTRKRDHETGLSNVQFLLTSKVDMTISGFSCHIFNVELICDEKLTPWCKFTSSKKLQKARTVK